MNNILLIDEHPETKNLLMKCLETAGCVWLMLETTNQTLKIRTNNDETSNSSSTCCQKS
ncbi:MULTISPECIES: hypothetical protein [Brasilonema]|uniref:hypothetical protein n=1 Tax=Brasilonema TaxID=383614 RepID=UPI00145F9851|nr:MULTISPECIES: hypothetical protein [Brasilonema]